MREVELLPLLPLSSSLSPERDPPLCWPLEDEEELPRLDSSEASIFTPFLSKLLDSGAPPLLCVESLARGLSLIHRGPTLRVEEMDLACINDLSSCARLSSRLDVILSMFCTFGDGCLKESDGSDKDG